MGRKIGCPFGPPFGPPWTGAGDRPGEPRRCHPDGCRKNPTAGNGFRHSCRRFQGRLRIGGDLFANSLCSIDPLVGHARRSFSRDEPSNAMATVHDSVSCFLGDSPSPFGGQCPQTPIFLAWGLGPFGPGLAKEGGGTGQSPATGKYGLSCTLGNANIRGLLWGFSRNKDIKSIWQF